MTPDAGLRDLLALGDLDGLVREADRRAAAEDWDGVVALRDACLAATAETGRQLWGPARYAAYRVALDGPAPLAAAMLEVGVSRHGLGPLTEVVAQHHPFADLAERLDGPLRSVVAQERVLRGEDLRADPRAEPSDPETPPLRLEPFEPAYVLPTYRATERVDGAPLLTAGADVPIPAGGATGSVKASPPLARAVADALHEAVATWESASDARVRTIALGESTAADAVRAVAPDARVARTLGLPDLLALIAFAGASGGVHGARRGGAAGRAAAWWVARTAVGLTAPGVPLDVDELEFRLEDLELVAFATPGPAAWRLQVAVADPATGAAAAVSAVEPPVGHPHGARGDQDRGDDPGVRP